MKDNNTGIKIRANEDYAILTKNGITEEIFAINGNIPDYSLRPFADTLKYENVKSLLEFRRMENEENYSFALKENSKVNKQD